MSSAVLTAAAGNAVNAVTTTKAVPVKGLIERILYVPCDAAAGCNRLDRFAALIGKHEQGSFLGIYF